MSTSVIERPDLEIVETEDDKPDIAHAFCFMCYPVSKPGDIARCGHVSNSYSPGEPESVVAQECQLCVVCLEITRSLAPCPRCGW